MTAVANHIDILAARIPLSGQKVLDVGAGDGSFARQLAALGARVTGIEVDEVKVERARGGQSERTEFLLGVAEDLPVEDDSQDITTFVFSLHHVPLDHQDRAIAEVRRVLRRDGQFIAIDPRPYGDMTEVVKPVEDEAHVRTVTQRRLDGLGAESGFVRVEKTEYLHERRYRDLEELIEHVVLVDAARASRLPEARPALERLLAQYGRPEGNGLVLTQPVVMYRFRRNGEI